MIKQTFFKRGFTLIELMVVIVIIGILATLGLVTYRNALIRSRDSRAIGGVKDIISALEQQKAAEGINAYYKDLGTSGATCGGTISSDFTVPTGNPNAFKCYAKGSTSLTRTSYCVSVLMENDKNGNCGACDCTGTACTYTTGTGNTTSFCAITKQ